MKSVLGRAQRRPSGSERGNRKLRALDRYVGVPLVVAGGLMKRRARPAPRDIRRIGVLNSTLIGDTVVLSPVLKDLAAAYPGADVLFFVGDRTQAIAKLIDGVSPVPITITSPASAVRAIRAAELDVLLDFDSWPRIEPVYAMFSGVRFAAGFETAGAHRHYWYDATARHTGDRHEIDNYRALARVIGVESSSEPRLRPARTIDRTDLPQQPYVVFHLWPTGLRADLKEWPADAWYELAAHMIDGGFRVALTGSKSDEERTRAFVDASGSLRAGLDNLAGKYDLDGVLDVLSESRCVVSVNTGIMHLAAAVGAPTISLNGPTSEHRWGPVGGNAVSVNSCLPGCGYLHLGWEYRGHRTDCMRGISVDRVKAAVRELIDDR